MPPQTFEATPTLVGPNVKWKLCHTNPNPDVCGTSNGSYPKVDLPVNSGATTFEFKIVNDKTGLEIMFPNSGALVIKKGEPVGPTLPKQIGNPSGQGSDTLKFIDKNSLPDKDHPDPITITYGLNFVDKYGKAVTSIDPDITNGGTNRLSLADYLIPVAIGLVAGIVLTVLYRTLILRRAW